MSDAAAPAAAPRRGLVAQQKLWAFASLILLLAFFSFASPNFLQTANILAVLQATAVNGVLAIAVTMIIITGGIDLSIGTLMTFCAVTAGVVLTYWGMPLPLGVAAAIAMGAFCGLVLSLQPGDVISTGTPPGVGLGQKPPRYLKGGETIRLGIDGLGVQTQKVVRA